MSQCTVPDILLTPYVLYDIVSSERINKFDLAIDILEELVLFGCTSHVSIPGGKKLLIALKLKYVLEQIRRQANSVSMIVEKYFPPRSKHTQGNALYREFLNILIEEKEVQERFFETDYTREFGSEFFSNLKRMTKSLVLKIVPISEIVKKMQADSCCFLDRLNLLSTKKSQNIGDLQSVLALSFNYRDELPFVHGSYGCSSTRDLSVAQRHQENVKKTKITNCLQQCQNTGVVNDDYKNNFIDIRSETDGINNSVTVIEHDLKKDQMKFDVGEQQNVDVSYNNFSSLVCKQITEHVFKNDKDGKNEGKKQLKQNNAGQNLDKTIDINTCIERKARKANENNCMIKERKDCYIKASNEMNYQIEESSDQRNAQKDDKFHERSEVDEKINEINVQFDECNENSNLKGARCKKRRIKCSKSLIDMLFDDQKVKYLKLDKFKVAEKCTLRRKQLKSKSVKVLDIPSVDVEKFYTSFKERNKIKDESLDAGVQNSAVKTELIVPGLENTSLDKKSSDFHFLNRLKCTKRSSKIKIRKKGNRKPRKNRNRYKRGKKVYTCIKKTKSNNITANKNSGVTGSINYGHSESLNRVKKDQAQSYNDCKGRSYPKHMLSLKHLDLSPSDPASVKDKTKEKDSSEKLTMVVINDHQDNNFQVFNHVEETSKDFDSSLRNLEKENEFGRNFESKLQDVVLNDTPEALVQSSKAYTSVKKKEEDNLCLDKTFSIFLETTDDTVEERLSEKSDLDTVIPPSVEASPEYIELDIFEEEASYIDNTVQYLPDFTRFLKKFDPIE